MRERWVPSPALFITSSASLYSSNPYCGFSCGKLGTILTRPSMWEDLAIDDGASIWMQHLARHIRSILRGQKDIARCHLFWFSCPLQGDIRAKRCHLFCGI